MNQLVKFFKGIKQNPAQQTEEKVPAGKEAPKTQEWFIINCEQVAGQGEDYFLYEKKNGAELLGVFDGCGGSGARTYPEFENHTGAYVASRILAEAVKVWFDREYGEKDSAKEKKTTVPETDGQPEAKSLKAVMDKALCGCRKQCSAGSVLLGNLKKEFPSTMALAVVKEKENETVFYWCGDSRGYVLDEEGLHQVTADDTAVTDAMENLREDAPMTNVASASHPYEVRCCQRKLKRPFILLTATDGCFGYLPTPMEFEKLLLETMAQSDSLKKWQDELTRRIGEVAGDDFTMALCLKGFPDFGEAKEKLKQRLAYMRENFPLDKKTQEKELLRQWKEYRKTYEKLMEKKEDEC